MAPRSNSSGFVGVRARPNGTFYAEIRAGGQRLTLGTCPTAEQAARAYDVVAWRIGRKPSTMNFKDGKSLEQAEFVAGFNNLVTAEQRNRRRQLQRRLVIAEADEHAMEQWAATFPEDVLDEHAFFAQKKDERMAERAARNAEKAEIRAAKSFIKAQQNSPQTIDDNDD